MVAQFVLDSSCRWPQLFVTYVKKWCVNGRRTPDKDVLILGSETGEI